MAKVSKSGDFITLSLTPEEVWKSWETSAEVMKSPAQVASEKGKSILNLENVQAIKYDLTSESLKITYYLNSIPIENMM